MKPRIPTSASSRQNKRQVIGWLDADLAERIHKYRNKNELTVQEVVAEAINRAVGEFGRKPILRVRRDGYIKRSKSISKPKENGVVPSRSGKRRLAAWFENQDIDRLNDFKSEVGSTIDLLMQRGMETILKENNL